jgi:hypothetical protein
MVVRILNWAGFVGCAVTTLVSIRELGALGSVSADHSLVAGGVTLGLGVAFVASGSARLERHRRAVSLVASATEEDEEGRKRRPATLAVPSHKGGGARRSGSRTCRATRWPT